jgi:penicillin-binding protein activator
MKNIMKYSFRLIVFTLAIFASVSCSRQVTRVSPDQQIDLSGRWNDTDSKLTAEALIEQLLTRNWIENYQQETGKKTSSYCWPNNE